MKCEESCPNIWCKNTTPKEAVGKCINCQKPTCWQFCEEKPVPLCLECKDIDSVILELEKDLSS